jgi:methylation protein EvaC
VRDLIDEIVMTMTKTEVAANVGEYLHHTTCRFCGSGNFEEILDFGNVPLAGGFLKPDAVASEEVFPLSLQFCQDCTLVQVNNAIPEDRLFKNYFYFSSKIQTLVDHCATFARDVHERFLQDRENPQVFEIGCNDGVMLRPFAELGVTAVGMDPASNVVASADQNGFTIIDDFFNRETATDVVDQHGQFDAITSSYSFAHIDDMVSVMDGVTAVLKEDGVFAFEVYYLGTLIDELQYDMIYHEHCSYYSLQAIQNFLKRYGMEVFDVLFTPGVRSGAVRFYARRIGQGAEPISSSVAAMAKRERDEGYTNLDKLRAYGSLVSKTRTDLMQLLDTLKADGKSIIGYGASGRGTMIMNYCGIDGSYLDYVVDDAPAKHGFLTPGMHVSIHDWEHTKEAGRPDYALLFAWSFSKEVMKKRRGYLEAGGKFIVPLPEVHVVGAEDLKE